ncbi:MAG: PHB depolymerase family esterase [Zavarzinella sp.]
MQASETLANHQRVQLTVGASIRTWMYYAPHSAADESLPLVLMLHGAGGSSIFSATETGWSKLAEHEKFVVVYPDGLPPDKEKPAKFLTNPQEWNDGSGRALNHQDEEFIIKLISSMLDRYPINARRIYLTGFSNGAGMAFRLAAHHPELFAAIAPVAGHCWLENSPFVRQIPTYYLIGGADPLMPVAGGVTRTPWGKIENRPSVLNSLNRWRTILQLPHLTSLENTHQDGFQIQIIPNLGHHWPGGAGQMGEKLGGPHHKEIDATQLIWDFFQKHSLKSRRTDQ